MKISDGVVELRLVYAEQVSEENGEPHWMLNVRNEQTGTSRYVLLNVPEMMELRDEINKELNR